MFIFCSLQFSILCFLEDNVPYHGGDEKKKKQISLDSNHPSASVSIFSFEKLLHTWKKTVYYCRQIFLLIK